MSDETRTRQYAAAYLRRPKDAPLALYTGEAALKSGAEEVASEAPHPDLSPEERMAIEHCYGVRQNWLDSWRRLIQRFAADAL